MEMIMSVRFFVFFFTGVFLLNYTASAEIKKPNILLISIDDLNNWVGYMKGHPQVKTPYIDKLAAMGTAFTDAHCSSPLCNPSRTAIMSGFHAVKTGVFGNKNGFDFKKFELMPQYFAKHGYRTFGVGKLLHSRVNKAIFEVGQTYEQRWSPFQQSQSVLYTKGELLSKGTNNPVHHIKNGPGGKDYILPFNRMPSDRNPHTHKGESHDWHAFDLPDNAFGDGMAAEWAINQLKKHDDKKPFFMGVGFYRPHIPLYAPKKYFDLYPLKTIKLPEYREDDLDDLSSTGKKWALEAVTAGSHKTTLKHKEWQKAVQAYLACVSFIDAQVGKIFNYLENSSYAENTIIVLFSDHGWHLGEKQHWGKWTGWDRSTRVPFIIVRPGQQKGEMCHAPVSLIDIYPTLTDMAGLPAPKLDGTSIKGLVENPKIYNDRTVFSYFGKGNYAVINKEWRLIRYADGSQELYNRVKDPHEYTNLINKAQYHEVIKVLESEIPKWRE
jgi:arylsulfatase A-like enzyme